MRKSVQKFIDRNFISKDIDTGNYCIKNPYQKGQTITISKELLDGVEAYFDDNGTRIPTSLPIEVDALRELLKNVAKQYEN